MKKPHFHVAGTSCPRPSLEHPAPSFVERKKPSLLQAGTFVPKGPSDESSMNPPLLRPSSPSMLDVGCSMFDVHPPARYVACGDNVGAARPRRPTGKKSQNFMNQECIWSFSDPQ
jgi:hypothetical protein